MHTCSIIGCNRRKKKINNTLSVTSLHRFPRDEARRRRWIEIIGRDNLKPVKYGYICSLHFHKSSYFRDKKKIILKDDAEPSVSLMPSRNNNNFTTQTNKNSEEVLEILLKIPSTSRSLVEPRAENCNPKKTSRNLAELGAKNCNPKKLISSTSRNTVEPRDEQCNPKELISSPSRNLVEPRDEQCNPKELISIPSRNLDESRDENKQSGGLSTQHFAKFKVYSLPQGSGENSIPSISREVPEPGDKNDNPEELVPSTSTNLAEPREKNIQSRGVDSQHIAKFRVYSLPQESTEKLIPSTSRNLTAEPKQSILLNRCVKYRIIIKNLRDKVRRQDKTIARLKGVIENLKNDLNRKEHELALEEVGRKKCLSREIAIAKGFTIKEKVFRRTS